MKFCPICNEELKMLNGYFSKSCMNNDHFYQYFLRTKNQIARFHNNYFIQDIKFASCDNIFHNYCYLEDFSILANSSHEEAKSIYNKIKVFK